MSTVRSLRMTMLSITLVAGVLACSHKTKEEKAKVDVGMPPEVAAEFKKRVEAYADTARRLEAKLPKLPKDPTPKQIDVDQRTFEQLIVAGRADAKPGDIFIPEMQAYIRSLLVEVFDGPLGTSERNAVHDEAHPVRPVINKRYPDEVPLATMPPKLLANLPKLPAQLEYRFVHNDLILMDVHAHIILDYVEGAMAPATAPATTTP